MSVQDIDARNALWYKDAIIYQLHVRSFFDGNDDGIGDFAGLTKKLGYLEALGITAVWLLPFYPSPLRDDGYDITDYIGINPIYGTMADFKLFLDEAHRRGIRVITELVLNHTSDQHEWFKKSREAEPGSYWREFYVWSDTNKRYQEARIIFKDFEISNWTWDHVGRAYYWHRFYSHQPDLNFENTHVHKALFRVIDFWFGMGVDGLRLDAVPYLYEQEGTNCENLPQTFEFLKKLRAHVDEKFSGRMLIAEANQWPDDAVAYFGQGDMCHMAYHFPLMPRMFMALQMEDRFPILDILDQLPSIPETAQWAIFLRNHDELTLEMVSEEERDFMYRSYARELSARINLGIRRRLAPLLLNSRRRIELMNILLLSLPGSPVIYYGDEIGMGDNQFLGDRDGVRTPMHWSPDRNAGFSPVTPQQLFLPVNIDPEYHYQSVNVENEEHNLASLLWWMRRAITMRRSFRAFSYGRFELVKSNNPSILSFVRKHDEGNILVVINLSRFNQPVTLDLPAYIGATPVDVFSGNRFPRVSAASYQLTPGSYDYFWLHLKPDNPADPRTESYALPTFRVERSRWQDIFTGPAGEKTAGEILPAYLQQRTTAGRHLKQIQRTLLIDQFPVKHDGFTGLVLIIKVQYIDRDENIILLPLTSEREDIANSVIGDEKGLLFGRVQGEVPEILYDCAYHPLFLKMLLEMMTVRRTLKSANGLLFGSGKARPGGDAPAATPPSVHVIKAGQRTTSIAIDDKIFAKLFREIETAPNPEIEIVRALSEPLAPVIPQIIGSLSYRAGDNTVYDLGFCTEYFHSSRTLQQIALDDVSQYLETALARGIDRESAMTLSRPERAERTPPASEIPPGILFEKKAHLLGELTARMHRTLAEIRTEPFRMEPFTTFYQHSIYQTFRGLVHRVFSQIEANLGSFPESAAAELRTLLVQEETIRQLFTPILKSRLPTVRIRIHGDYQLGRILIMDEQIRICDLGGTSTLPQSDRRRKRSPLFDVASMIHSIHCTSQLALLTEIKIQDIDRQLLQSKAEEWSRNMGKAFFESYTAALKDTMLVSFSAGETRSLMRMFLIERALSHLERVIPYDKQQTAIACHCLFHYLKEGGSPE